MVDTEGVDGAGASTLEMIEAVTWSGAFVEKWSERLACGVRIGDRGGAMWREATREVVLENRRAGLLQRLKAADQLSPDPLGHGGSQLLIAWLGVMQDAADATADDESRERWDLAEGAAKGLVHLFAEMAGRLRAIESGAPPPGLAVPPPPPGSLLEVLHGLHSWGETSPAPIDAGELRWNPLSSRWYVAATPNADGSSAVEEINHAEAEPGSDLEAKVDDGPLFAGRLVRKLPPAGSAPIEITADVAMKASTRLAELRLAAGSLTFLSDGSAPDFPVTDIARIGDVLSRDERDRIVRMEQCWLRLLQAAHILFDSTDDELDSADNREMSHHIGAVAADVGMNVDTPAWQEWPMWQQIRRLAADVRDEVRTWTTEVVDRLVGESGGPLQAQASAENADQAPPEPVEATYLGLTFDKIARTVKREGFATAVELSKGAMEIAFLTMLNARERGVTLSEIKRLSPAENVDSYRQVRRRISKSLKSIGVMVEPAKWKLIEVDTVKRKPACTVKNTKKPGKPSRKTVKKI